MHNPVRHKGLRGLLMCGLALLTLTYPAPATTAATNQLIVDVKAFRAHGQLAFVWNARLDVLDGNRGMVHQLTHSGQVLAVAWSPDRRWLAYIQAASTYASTQQLYVTHADGGQLHAIGGLPASVQAFVWSPVADVLAVIPGPAAGPAGGLWLATPTGGAREVAVAATSVRWSPDGKNLAYSLTLPFHDPQTRSDALYTMPVGGVPARRFVATGSGITVAGWGPDGVSLLYWVDPQHSSSLAADGSQLFVLPLRTGSLPSQLATMLAYPDWLSWAPMDRRVALVRGDGRESWRHKTIVLCDSSVGPCRALAPRPGMVEIDPSWSPRGDRIAFVMARDVGAAAAGMPGPLTGSWTQTRTLWIAHPDGTGLYHVRAAGHGVYAPQWSRDGRYLLYVRDNAVWLIDAAGRTAVRVVSPLIPSTAAPADYYGHIAWSSVLAWDGG